MSKFVILSVFAVLALNLVFAEEYQNTCANVKCWSGHHCEMRQVQCIRAPCPPQPMCVPDEPDVCTGHECAPGEKCVSHIVQCIRAPCPAQPYCIPA